MNDGNTFPLSNIILDKFISFLHDKSEISFLFLSSVVSRSGFVGGCIIILGTIWCLDFGSIFNFTMDVLLRALLVPNPIMLLTTPLYFIFKNNTMKEDLDDVNFCIYVFCVGIFGFCVYLSGENVLFSFTELVFLGGF